MGKTTGFMEIERKTDGYQAPAERVKHYKEFIKPLPIEVVSEQGARCMDCGIPFCHNGCPLNNLIPDWNDLVYKNNWKKAIATLHSTNNFPEFTGRICPAPCEEACTLNIQSASVTIREIERNIIDYAWDKGWITPQIPTQKTGKSVAVVGSGPAGMACAQQLARAGYTVTLFEKADRIGGLLRYGIPEFKLDKKLIDLRAEQMQAEGVKIETSTLIGAENVPAHMAKLYKKVISAQDLLAKFDAIALCGGAENPRDLPVPGREFAGVHFALEFLGQQHRINSGDKVENKISANGKNVVIIGGGDTGSDCVGTSNRHGAKSITQIEVMPRPPEKENKEQTWPYWPMKMRTSTSHDEGCVRDFAISTKKFIGDINGVKAMQCVRVEWEGTKMKEVTGSEFELPADLVFLAMGFTAPLANVLEAFAVEKDSRGNAKADFDGNNRFATSSTKVFSAGDMRRGQSLVVWAIREGRDCASAIDEFLRK